MSLEWWNDGIVEWRGTPTGKIGFVCTARPRLLEAEPCKLASFVHNPSTDYRLPPFGFVLHKSSPLRHRDHGAGASPCPARGSRLSRHGKGAASRCCDKKNKKNSSQQSRKERKKSRKRNRPVGADRVSQTRQVVFGVPPRACPIVFGRAQGIAPTCKKTILDACMLCKNHTPPRNSHRRRHEKTQARRGESSFVPSDPKPSGLQADCRA